MAEYGKREQLKLAIAEVGRQPMGRQTVRHPKAAGQAYDMAGKAAPGRDAQSQMNSLYSVTENVFSQISRGPMKDEIKGHLLPRPRSISPRHRDPDRRSSDYTESRGRRRERDFDLDARGRRGDRDSHTRDRRDWDSGDVRHSRDEYDMNGSLSRGGPYTVGRRESDSGLRSRHDDRGRREEWDIDIRGRVVDMVSDMTNRRTDYDINSRRRMLDYEPESRARDIGYGAEPPVSTESWDPIQQRYISSMDVTSHASGQWPEYTDIPDVQPSASAMEYWPEATPNVIGQEIADPWSTASAQGYYDEATLAAPAAQPYPAYTALPRAPHALARPSRPLAPRGPAVSLPGAPRLLGPTVPGAYMNPAMPAARPRAPAPPGMPTPGVRGPVRGPATPGIRIGVPPGVRGPAPPGAFRGPVPRVRAPGSLGILGQTVPSVQPAAAWPGVTPPPTARPYAPVRSPVPGAPMLPQQPFGAPAVTPQPTGMNALRFPINPPPGSSKLLTDFLMLTRPNLELATLTNHVAEFARDQYGSRFIQEKLASATPAVKSHIFKEVIASVEILIMNIFGNFVVQKVFELGTRQEKQALASCFTGKIARLVFDQNASKVIQKALESIAPTMRTELIRELDGKIMNCVMHAHSNHVLQKALENIDPERLQFIVDGILGKVGELCKNACATHVVQSILEFCTADQNVPVIAELEVSCSQLVEDKFGNYVLQRAVECGRKEDIAGIITILMDNILEFSKHKFAVNVVEKAFPRMTPAELSAVIEKLCTNDKSLDNVLVGMIKDKYANYAVKELIEAASESDRTRMLKELRPHMTFLSSSKISNNLVIMLQTGKHPLRGGAHT